MDKIEKGTILHDLLPCSEALLPVMRNEKDKKGTTYQQIADTTGITLDTIKRFYSGEHKNPGILKVAALCRYFNLSMDALFGFVTTKDIVARTELEEKNAEIEALQEELQSTKEALAARTAEYEGRIAQYQRSLAESKDDKTQLVESLKKRNATLAEKEQDYKNEIKELKAEHREDMRWKNRVIKTLGIALGILVVLIITIFIIDKLNPNIGWFRY